MEVLKISSKSNPNSVAGAIAGLVKETTKAEMQAIGAGALNQAIKAVAIARGFVAPSGVDLICIPAFAEVQVEGWVNYIKFPVDRKQCRVYCIYRYRQLYMVRVTLIQSGGDT